MSTSSRKKTVGSQFRDSLTPHAKFKCPRRLTMFVVLNQTTLKRHLSLTHHRLYRPLVKNSKDINRQSPRATCETIVYGMISDEDAYRFGKSKIFFRAGQVAFLKIRMEKLQIQCSYDSKNVRGFIYKARYTKLKKSVQKLQNYGRGMLARRLALKLRQTRAAIRIQTCFRRWKKQKEYQRLRNITIQFQCRIRGCLARKKAQRLRMIKAAIIIQKYMRMWLEKLRFEKARQDIIKVQSCVRRWMAKRRLKELKTEARSLEHVRQLNKGLENKIISLQQKIEEFSKGANQNKKVVKDYEKIKVQLDNYKHMEKDLKAALEKIGELEGLNDGLEDELRGKMDARGGFVTTKVELGARMEDYGLQMGGWSEREKWSNRPINSCSKKCMTWNKILSLVVDIKDRRTTPVPRKSLAPNSLDSGLPSLDRSPSPTRRALQIGSPNQIQQNASEPDIGLVLVLQQKLRQSEKERESLEKQLEEQSATNPDSETRRTQDLIRLQELEMENAKLRDDLNHLRSADDKDTEISRQFQSLQEELARKKEESIQLRTLLASPNSWSGNSKQKRWRNTISFPKTKLWKTKSKSRAWLSVSPSTASVWQGWRSSPKHEVGGLTNENLTLRDHLSRLKTELESDTSEQRSHRNLKQSNDSMTAQQSELGPCVHPKEGPGLLGYAGVSTRRRGQDYASSILDSNHNCSFPLSKRSSQPYIPMFHEIRYNRFTSTDDNKVRSLLTSAITYIKRLMRKR
ncbi:Unconventional myosin-Vb [Orchesella cincta]|uniref:Unconventional myosin-Vb n=1 Tax=Orchesella cincta TaxID=48709 RepID=A0A1D2MNL5_ORCCI|nr:Unconventional myosin-Vb [Orchesella cincta]